MAGLVAHTGSRCDNRGDALSPAGRTRPENPFSARRVPFRPARPENSKAGWAQRGGFGTMAEHGLAAWPGAVK